jgi:D-aspartate oxidase
MALKVAVVGQGVIGCSAALALLERIPTARVTLFADRKFEQTCSYGPAGLFRMDKYETRKWAKPSFDRYAKLEREVGHATGIKLVSGFIQSDNRATLEGQERNYTDIVYNFGWLSEREISSLFTEPSKYCIHYTAYATEGRRYLPWLHKQLTDRSAQFVEKKITDLKELGNEFDVVVNSAGLDAGKLAGDDDSVYPIRGVAFEIEAPWHKHFNYRDFETFTIPMTDSVILGLWMPVD